ncbi:hypothetical protein ACFVHB_23790 [Kitasatospora sp. NPDC127111]|uniref:hypothetical protein n=1 Tax=Kitasatospora sp. NPDC127111 TaxID=3345363 RepID=UPI00363F32A0
MAIPLGSDGVLAREAITAPEFSSIEEWLGRARNTYRFYDVLAEVGGPVWTPERDTLPWVRFACTPTTSRPGASSAR